MLIGRYVLIAVVGLGGASIAACSSDTTPTSDDKGGSSSSSSSSGGGGGGEKSSSGSSGDKEQDTNPSNPSPSNPGTPTQSSKKENGAQCKESADCKSDFCVFKTGGTLGMCTKTCDDNIDCDLGSKCVKLGDAPQKACVPE